MEKQKLTVKFISQEAHMGSEVQSVTRLKTLSKASGKFNAILNASIKEKARGVEESVAIDEKANENERSSGKTEARTSKRNTTKVHTIEVDATHEEAVVIANRLFDFMEKSGNSESYTAKKAAFDSAKRETLKEFSVDSYSDLTDEEKQMYAKKMIAKKAPFNYTERSIHIRYGTNATVYSRTQRVAGVHHWSNDTYTNLVDVEKLLSKYAVIFRDKTKSEGHSSTE